MADEEFEGFEIKGTQVIRGTIEVSNFTYNNRNYSGLGIIDTTGKKSLFWSRVRLIMKRFLKAVVA